MTPTEKLVAALRQVEAGLPVYANVIPEREAASTRRAIVFIETSDEQVINFSGSIRANTTFRVQFRSERYQDADEMSRRFSALAGRQVPPMTITGASTGYDEDLNLQLRESSVTVR